MNNESRKWLIPPVNLLYFGFLIVETFIVWLVNRKASLNQNTYEIVCSGNLSHKEPVAVGPGDPSSPPVREMITTYDNESEEYNIADREKNIGRITRIPPKTARLIVQMSKYGHLFRDRFLTSC